MVTAKIIIFFNDVALKQKASTIIVYNNLVKMIVAMVMVCLQHFLDKQFYSHYQRFYHPIYYYLIPPFLLLQNTNRFNYYIDSKDTLKDSLL